MSFFGVVFICLMILWLVLGCYVGWLPGPSGHADFRPVVGYTLLPWACVAVLGYLILGGPLR